MQPTPTPIAQPLDTYLWEVIQTLNQAVDRGIRNAAEHPDVTQGTINDCEEILDVIMKGDVPEWLGVAS